jgi:hypothetical protein
VKIWTGYGSEHSYSLVMIGRFVDHAAALATKEKFDELTEVVAVELEAGRLDVGWEADERMSGELRDALNELRIYDLGVSDISNFAYDFSTHLKDDTVMLRTDEGEVQGFLKLMIDGGARIEVFSAHHWPEEGEPRQAEE